MSIAIKGVIAPLASDSSVATSESSTFKGRVWIGDDGRVAAVTRGTKAGPKELQGTRVVDVGSCLVLPGLIDLHSHLAYATLPLWEEPDRTVPFAHHDIWPSRPTYAKAVTWPAYAFVVASPAELLAYAEVRAVIGGTTSIQGSPPRNRPLDGWLVRNVEDERFSGGVGEDQILASTLPMKSDQLARRANQMRAGATFIYHCAEGQPGSIVAREYTAVGQAGCLQGRLIAIHTNALGPDAYGAWTTPGTIVWSPFSNLWLYGTTTDIPAARARRIRVCLGSDWGPSGTRNVLGELKVAQLVSEARGWSLSTLELLKMVTANPGDALAAAWGVQAGRLQPGALGDVVVISAPAGKSWVDGVMAATEAAVELVVIGGRPVYGTTERMQAAGATGTSSLVVNGVRRSLALSRFDEPGKRWPFDEVLARMTEVAGDPKGEIEGARLRASAALREGKPPPLRLALDMPTGRAPIGGLPKDLNEIEVPPLAPLAHDPAFFASLIGHGFHGGLLDGLAGFYA